jgi:hypothetical protein
VDARGSRRSFYSPGKTGRVTAPSCEGVPRPLTCSTASGIGRRARTGGEPQWIDGYRGARLAGEGEGSTWRRGTSRGTQCSDRGSRARLGTRVRWRTEVQQCGARAGVPGALAGATSRRSVQINSTGTV